MKNETRKEILEENDDDGMAIKNEFKKRLQS